ncbi:MAG TPA: DUF3667 domain-containing protein [Chitinophagaceae bacterium]|nr:DUF3667 domain-containing protein [Chitinophagaceae bacterium]
MNCKSCNNECEQNYCSNCGHPTQLKRINWHYITHEIEHVLHFERGILLTVRELLIRPGQNIKHFISEDRNRLVKPIIYIIVTSFIYSLINNFFHIEEAYVNFNLDNKSATAQIMKWIQAHYGYANIGMGIFIALWLKIFFKKKDYNLFEILILLCFVLGTAMLLYAVFALIQGISHIDILGIGGIITFAYCTWAIGQFFDKSKIGSYIKSFLAYLLGMLTSLLFVVLVGKLIDSIFQ